MKGMLSGDRCPTISTDEFAGRVATRGVEKPKANNVVNCRTVDQRFLDKGIERIRHLMGIEDRVRRHALRSVKSESADKNRKPTQELSIRRRQQVVTPIEHRVERPMPRQGSATSLPQQLESIVEKLFGPSNAICSDATRNQFYGECYPVQPAANVGYDPSIVIR